MSSELNYRALTGGTLSIQFETGTINYPSSLGYTSFNIGPVYPHIGPVVVAVSDIGYSFDRWNDDPYKAASRQDTGITFATAYFVRNALTLTYSASDGGVISPYHSGPYAVNRGANGPSVTAVNDSHHHFLYWSDDHSNTNPVRQDVNVAEDITAQAVFAPNTYTITYSSDGPGSLSGPLSQTVVYNANSATVTATPSAHSHLVNWSDGQSALTHHIENVDQNWNIVAHFHIDQFTVSYTCTSGGNIVGETTQLVDYDGSTTFVGAPDTVGYSFVKWADNDSTNPTRQDTHITANHTFQAIFAIKSFTFTYTSGVHGKLLYQGNEVTQVQETVNYHANGPLVNVVPDPGYRLNGWSDTMTNGIPRQDYCVGSNVTAEAQFIGITYDLLYAPGSNCTLSGVSTQSVAYHTSGTAVTVVPSTGYHFVNWSDGSTQNPRTDTNVEHDVIVTANCAINTYTLTYSANSGGTINGTVSQTVNYHANGTQVTAVPNLGYTFTSWSDGVLTPSRTELSVIVNHTVSASFTANTNTVTKVAGPGGTLTGSATIVTGTTQVYTVTTNPGYTFQGLTTTLGTISSYPYTLSGVTGSVTITATWTANSNAITVVKNISAAGSVSLPTTINTGANQAFTVTTNAGYTINEIITSNGTITGTYPNDLHLSGVTQATTITVSWKYNITYNTVANGSITGLASVLPSTPTTITASKKPGYTVATITASPSAVITGSYPTYSLAAITASTTLTATITANINNLAYVGGIGGSITGPANVVTGVESLAINVTTNSGYSFSGLTISDSNVTCVFRSPSYYLTGVTQATTITANWTTRPVWNLSYVNDPPDAGVITAPASVFRSAPGNTITIVPLAFLGFQIRNVTTTSGGVTQSAPYVLSNVSSDNTVVTVHYDITHTLTYSAGDHGSITGSSPQTVVQGNSGSQVVATPDAHYHFTDWSDGSLQGASRRDQNVQIDVSAIASFEIDQYSLTYNSGQHGSLVGITHQTVDWNSSGTPLLAVPDQGYNFIEWSDHSVTNPRQDTNVASNIVVSAVFDLEDLSIRYTAGPGGSIIGDEYQQLKYGQSGTQVTAIPDQGYRFVNWSDDSTINPRSETNVQHNVDMFARFALVTNTLQYSADVHGSISGTVTQHVVPGATGSWVTAVPDSGYRFVEWSDHSTQNPRRDSASVNVIASFATAITYTLTYIAGTNGSLDGETEQTVQLGSSGTVVTANPAEHYHFSHWTGGSIQNPRTDTNVRSNITVTAHFAINEFTLTYNNGLHGIITGSKVQSIPYGESGIPITVVPATGYHFVKWSDDSTVNPRTDIDVVANITVTATYAKDSFTLEYAAGSNGSLTGDSSQTVDYGEEATAVIAVPDEFYHFVEWSDGSKLNPRCETNVHTNVSVMASFAFNTFTLNYRPGTHCQLIGTTHQTVNQNANGTEVSVVPDVGYTFLRWSDGSTDGSRQDTNVQGKISVVATVIPISKTITYVAGEHGTLTGSASQTLSYNYYGSSITAVPVEGYHFVEWSEDSDTNATRNDKGTAEDQTFTAVFEINASHTLTYTAGSNGSITGTSPQTVAWDIDGTEVTAIADEDYHFVEWSDHSTDNPRTDTNVQDNITVEASFAEDVMFTLTYSTGSHGSIEGTTPQSTQQGSDGTAVTAVTTSDGYHFVEWSDHSTDNPRTDTNVQGNITVEASFAEDVFFNLEYSIEGFGALVGDTDQTILQGTSGTQVQATADEGYHFKEWSDHSTQNPRCETNVQANVVVSAIFRRTIDFSTLLTTLNYLNINNTDIDVSSELVETRGIEVVGTDPEHLVALSGSDIETPYSVGFTAITNVLSGKSMLLVDDSEITSIEIITDSATQTLQVQHTLDCTVLNETPLRVSCPDHGLTTGNLVMYGPDVKSITVVDPDTFTLDGTSHLSTLPNVDVVYYPSLIESYPVDSQINFLISGEVVASYTPINEVIPDSFGLITEPLVAVTDSIATGSITITPTVHDYPAFKYEIDLYIEHTVQDATQVGIYRIEDDSLVFDLGTSIQGTEISPGVYAYSLSTALLDPFIRFLMEVPCYVMIKSTTYPDGDISGSKEFTPIVTPVVQGDCFIKLITSYQVEGLDVDDLIIKVPTTPIIVGPFDEIFHSSEVIEGATYNNLIRMEFRSNVTGGNPRTGDIKVKAFTLRTD